MVQLREQRDRAEKDLKEEKELHDRELTDYKMKIHRRFAAKQGFPNSRMIAEMLIFVAAYHYNTFPMFTVLPSMPCLD